MKKIVIVHGILIVVVLAMNMASADMLIIRPNAQGFYSQWVNSGCGSGTFEWQCVDEDPANILDHLYTSVKNKYESFAFQNIGLSNEIINSITLYYYGQRYSSIRYQFQPLVRASNTNYLGSVISLNSNYAYYSELYPTNPSTNLPWTAAEINALEAGMKSYSSNYGGRIAQVYAVVDYEGQNSCSDSDGGNVITILGTVSGNVNGTNYSNSDSCVTSGSVLEYFCNGDYAQSQQQSCGADGYTGNSYCLNGDSYRNYTDYFCGSGACSSNTSAILQQDCTIGCSNGQCLDDSCSDSDGGFVISVTGNTTGYLNQSSYTNFDSCLNNSTVIEYYCSGNYSNSMSSSCVTNSTAICSNGRCV